jgi:tetratricopeptide (TPR) repeat protein/ferredoxin
MSASASTLRPANRPPKKSPPDPLPGSKYSKWRALTLGLVYPLMALHVWHWRHAGKTLAPLELHEVMFTAELGIITAGFLLMLLVTLATLVFGRFFCSWGCHIMVLQDGASWLLRKLGIKPKPVRSRLLLWVPPLVLLYMFGWPQISRMWAARSFPTLRTQTDLEGISSFVTTNFWRNLPDPWITALTFFVCGFLIVYVLGSRAFCTYGCPYGALFLTVDRFAPGRIRVESDKCAQCGTCTAVCTSGVRVHEEVDRHGMVVNPRCLKDLDCVSACPEKALHYRWGAPSLGRLWSRRAILIAALVAAAAILVAVRFPGAQSWWAGRFDLVPFVLATAVLGLVAYGRTGMPARHYHFTMGEELLMAAMFVATLFVYRQLYDAIPFLLTIGLGAVVAYTTVVLLRLVSRPDVRALEHALKVGGKLRPAGWVYATAMIVFLAFSVHSALVQYHTQIGYNAFAAWRATGAPAAAPAGEASAKVDAREGAPALRDRALAHLLWSDRFGLFRSERLRESLAALFLGREDYARAESYLREVVARNPSNPEANLELGRSLIHQDRLAEANEALEQVLRVQTSTAFRRKDLEGLHGKAQYFLASIAATRGDLPAAERSLRESVRLAPDLARAHYDLGTLLLADGRVDEAADRFADALRAEPSMAEAHYNLAIARFHQGRAGEAIAEAETALALAPRDAQTRALLDELKRTAPAAIAP